MSKLRKSGGELVNLSSLNSALKCTEHEFKYTFMVVGMRHAFGNTPSNAIDTFPRYSIIVLFVGVVGDMAGWLFSEWVISRRVKRWKLGMLSSRSSKERLLNALLTSKARSEMWPWRDPTIKSQRFGKSSFVVSRPPAPQGHNKTNINEYMS